ncbi:hypothetical protein IPC475_28675 [Pseudomonas aeruginosa]|nr:hypothetical protein IPC475_28675 [Pseudomonas aeruginosa]
MKKPTPVQPVESRQDVVVASGTNTLIPISRGQINRLVTPFDNPHIQTVSEAEISTSGNVIYVTTQDEKPVTMFVTPEDDESVAISLTLLPQGVPPIQANLILAKNVQGLASGMPITSSTNYSGQARKWERSQPYMDTLRSLMREMALGKLPRGYSFGALPAAHATREQRKREAHNLIHSAPSAGEELAGVEQLVNAWYDRSLESAIGNGDWKKHPSLAEYAAMIVPTVEAWLRQSRVLYLSKYGCNRGVIPEGQTTWVQPEG